MAEFIAIRGEVRVPILPRIQAVNPIFLRIALVSLLSANGGVFDAKQKILTLGELPRWRAELRGQGQKLVVTNGCFDLLHAGHIKYLEAARNLGDALLVGLNGDASVRQLKGAGRPLNSENDRALVLAALGCVDAVAIFPEMRADKFLEIAQPGIYVKGGDYTLDTLDQNERRVVESAGGKIAIMPLVPGKSTTALIRKMPAGCPESSSRSHPHALQGLE